MNKTTLVSQPSITRTEKTSLVPAKRSLRLDQWLIWLASHLILIFFTIVVAYPVVWMFLASFISIKGLLLSTPPRAMRPTAMRPTKSLYRMLLTSIW